MWFDNAILTAFRHECPIVKLLVERPMEPYSDLSQLNTSTQYIKWICCYLRVLYPPILSSELVDDNYISITEQNFNIFIDAQDIFLFSTSFLKLFFNFILR